MVPENFNPLPENSLLLGVNAEDERLPLLVSLGIDQSPLLIVAYPPSLNQLKKILQQNYFSGSGKRAIVLEKPENFYRLERELELSPSIIFGPGLNEKVISKLGLTEPTEILLVQGLQSGQIAARTTDPFNHSKKLQVFNLPIDS